MTETPELQRENENGSLPGPGVRWLWAIIVAYLLLAGAAAWMMPLTHNDPRWPEQTRQKFIPPDEEAHIGYIQYLIDHRRLPVFEDPDANYEAHQPPVFYLSCIPAFLAGRAVGELVTPSETLMSAVFFVRLWCVLIGAGVIYAVYLLGLYLFPKSHRLALAAAAFAALLPMHWVNVAGVTNDGLCELMATVALIAACSLSQKPTARKAITLGLLIGVGVLVKSTMVIMFAVAVFAIGMAKIEDDGREKLWTMAKLLGTVCGIAILVCGWWLLRNQLLYGDPLVQKAFVELFSQDRATPQWFFDRGLAPSGYLMLVVVSTIFSYWGVFGQAIVYMPAWYYLIGFALWLPMFVGLLKVWWQGRKQEDTTLSAPWVLSAVTVLLAGFVLLRFNMSFFQAQARYLFVAIGPIAGVFVAGWWQMLPGPREQRKRYWRTVMWVIFVCLGVMALVALWNLQPGSPIRFSPITGM
ncbi:MAG: glycosyltransferase family 39 protein [Armatimonadota bacterium]